MPWFEASLKSPFIKDVKRGIDLLDSLEITGVIRSQLTKQEFWISLHTTSSDEFTPLFIISAKTFEWQISNISRILEKIWQRTVQFESQEFNDRTITLLKSGEIEFAFLIEGDYLVFSQSALLIEDVIRSIQNEENRLFKNEQDGFDDKGKLQAVINMERLNELKGVFLKKTEKQFFEFEGNLTLNIDFDQYEITFSGSGGQGFATTPDMLASLFGKNLIPRTSGAFSWRPVELDLGWDGLLEPAVCTIDLTEAASGVDRKVHMFTAMDSISLRAKLNRSAEAFLSDYDSAIYNERFINAQIGYMADEAFLQKELPGLGTAYYTLFQNMLLVSGNLDALKAVLVDFDEEATWGKSVENRPILDDLIQETDYTFLKDFGFATDPLKQRLKPKWLTFFNEHPELLDVLGLFKLQLNNTSSGLLVSGGVSFRERFEVEKKLSSEEDVPLTLLANAFADTTLVTKPFVVKNHNNSNLEVIFQDATNTLYLTSRQGEVMWKRTLNDPVLGDIHQVDFYNNKKLQYLIFTDSLIHLIDRNGDMVEGFPVPYTTASGLPFDGTELIDYDNSKRYRYLAKDRRGNLSLFDKEGSVLEDWDPKAMGGDLLVTPFHVRIRGRDCFVAVGSEGRVHLLNRRGEAYNGFPINISKRLSGDVALTRGANFEQTLISLVGEQGELVQLNLNGKVVMRKQLLRTSVNDNFLLSYDALNTTFNIVRNNWRKLTFFNANGEERFSVDYPNSGEIAVDFYNFRNGKEIFAIRDLKEGVMRLVNRNGDFLTGIILTKERVSILYYQNRLEYEVFVNFANQMNIYAVKPL